MSDCDTNVRCSRGTSSPLASAVMCKYTLDLLNDICVRRLRPTQAPVRHHFHFQAVRNWAVVSSSFRHTHHISMGEHSNWNKAKNGEDALYATYCREVLLRSRAGSRISMARDHIRAT